MAVYVDCARAPYRGMFMSHMVADTSEELFAMADRIGVARKWIQKAGTSHEHFDICQSKRRLALDAGAVDVTRYQLAQFLRERREKVNVCKA